MRIRILTQHYGNCFSFPEQVTKALQDVEKLPETDRFEIRKKKELRDFFNELDLNIKCGNYIIERTKIVEDWD